MKVLIGAGVGRAAKGFGAGVRTGATFGAATFAGIAFGDVAGFAFGSEGRGVAEGFTDSLATGDGVFAGGKAGA